MKKILIVLLVSLWFTGTASAADVGTTLLVTATVGGACEVVTNPVVFSGFDGSVDVYGEGQIGVLCPDGTAFNVALDAGQNYDMDIIYSGDRAISDGVIYYAYRLSDPTLTVEWGDSDYDNTYPWGTSFARVSSGLQDLLAVPGVLLAQPLPAVPGTYNDIINVTVYF